jgi:hypothetical protein
MISFLHLGLNINPFCLSARIGDNSLIIEIKNEIHLRRYVRIKDITAKELWFCQKLLKRDYLNGQRTRN